MCLAGALSILTYGMALIALSAGPTAPLAALRETGMLTALAISVFALGERVTAITGRRGHRHLRRLALILAG